MDSKSFFAGNISLYLLNTFVIEYLCNRIPKMRTKNLKNSISILAVVNNQNRLDASPPLMMLFMGIRSSQPTVPKVDNGVHLSVGPKQLCPDFLTLDPIYMHWLYEHVLNL